MTITRAAPLSARFSVSHSAAASSIWERRARALRSWRSQWRGVSQTRNRASWATLRIEDALETVLAEYAGGIVPPELRLAIKDAYQAAQITQAQTAKLLGLSRPHLANALAGRYPLSEVKAVKLRAFLAHPPPVVQPRLL